MIACCVEGPEAVVPRLRYAVEELLRSFGKTPVWTRAVDARIYAGPHPENAAPDAVRFRIGADSVSAILEPSAPSSVGWLMHHGERIPLPVGPVGTHVTNARQIVDADLLGSTFWWLTGLQEQVAPNPRMRYPFEVSLQARFDCALLPAVDHYRKWLGEALRQVGEPVRLRPWLGKDWALALTHDIDSVFTHRVRAWIGDTVRGHPVRGAQRLFGPDWRWESLVALRDLAVRRGVGATYFFKAGATTKEDVPYDVAAPALRDFIGQLKGADFEVGLHPSFGAADDGAVLRAERGHLAAALGEAPALVRMHYLRWSDPDTPRMLRRAGLRADSTLGFSASVGFRRGTCHPFRIFDLGTNKASDLWELPLAVMDTTLFTHRRFSIEQAEARTRQVLDAVRHVGGCAVVLWHNDMGEGAVWHERVEVLDRLIGHAAREGAAVGGLGALLEGRGVDLSVVAKRDGARHA